MSEPDAYACFCPRRNRRSRKCAGCRKRLAAIAAQATEAPAVPARINDTETRELFRAYIMGWRDRAVGRARRRDDFAHRPDLLAEYDRGERDGAEASNAAATVAAERLGYDLEHSVIDR